MMRQPPPPALPLTVDTTSTKPLQPFPQFDREIATHSRGSSGNSDYTSPATPSSERSRLADSTSSLASTPPADKTDSALFTNKSVLHDLVEDPSERDESSVAGNRMRSCSFVNDDSDFHTLWQPALVAESCDYDLSDGFHTDTEGALYCQTERRGSAEETPSPVAALKARLSQRMPSISRKLRDKRSFSSSISFTGVRSAPISRAPSIRSPSLTTSLVSPIEATAYITDAYPLPTSSIPRQIQSEISLPKIDEPIDRQSLASTPLLPPLMMERHAEPVQSPLQSPTVVESPAFTFPTSAATTPLASNMQSPTLSTKASTTSFSMSYASQAPSTTGWHASAEMLVDTPRDEWSDILGHANFTIAPAPYTPVICDLNACMSLTADWELARKRYLAHASRVSEDYGPTSHVFKLTEQKWASIDSTWKQNYDTTIGHAETSGVDVASLPQLSERTTLARIPTIEGPDGNGKTMTFSDNGEIVGPMVTYVSRIKPQSKKNAFMRFFQDLRLSNN